VPDRIVGALMVLLAFGAMGSLMMAVAPDLPTRAAIYANTHLLPMLQHGMDKLAIYLATDVCPALRHAAATITSYLRTVVFGHHAHILGR
jgi:hypothetical protein